MKASESVPNLHIQMQMLPINDTAGAMKLIRSYYREWQGPEIYAKALEYNTIQIFKGLTLMDFFEVVLLAKKNAETVGRPVDQQLLKYLIVRAAQAVHNKYWKELNRWLQDTTISKIDLFELYQNHVLVEHEVDMDMRYSDNNPECNQLAM